MGRFASYDPNEGAHGNLNEALALSETDAWSGIVNLLNFTEPGDAVVDTDPLDEFVRTGSTGIPVGVNDVPPGGRIEGDSYLAASENFTSTFCGLINLDAPGLYTFRLGHDDGVRLTIGDCAVIDKPALTAFRNDEGRIIIPEAGRYPILIEHHENSGDANLVFEYQPPGDVNQLVPTSALFPDPPIINCPADEDGVQCGDDTSPDALDSVATCSSDCRGCTVTFSDDAEPGDCGDEETITRTWMAEDDCGNRVTCDQIITVVDTTAPTITDPMDHTIVCPATPVFEPPTCDDTCGECTVSPTSDTFTDTCPEVHTRCWKATDDCGLMSPEVCQTITVVDVTPPEIFCPPDTAVEPAGLDCKVTFDTSATASDDCDDSPVITSDPSLPAMFDEIGDHTVTFTATDACGNDSSCTMTVTVLPTPYCLKREAIEALEALLGVDSEDDDLIDAIGFLHMSLGEKDDRAGMSGSEVAWGDPNHVDTCHFGFKGADAFQYEQESCDKLDAYVENDENEGFGFEAAIDAVRESLAEADEMLAATAIADAIANGGDSDEIEVAEELKAEGDDATASGGSEICDKALDKYEEAWEKAVKSWCDSE